MLPSWLRPAFPDAGRCLVQLPQLQALTRAYPLFGTVLNAGCGEGAYCSWIASFPEVRVIENIDVDVKDWFFEVHRDPRHRLRRGSLTALPYADATFDAILCTEVLEHIPDDRAAVAELSRVLKPGGLLVASVPLRPAPSDPNHVRTDYAGDEFQTLLSGAGLDIVERRECCHALLRAVMRYWRRPLLRVPGTGAPYLPSVVLQTLARLDRALRFGQPWDLIVRATKR